MKHICLLALVFSAASYGMVKKASIDGELSHRYDENYEETQRSLASDIEKPEAAEEEAEKSGDRNPSSQGKSFDKVNENGIRYWKY